MADLWAAVVGKSGAAADREHVSIGRLLAPLRRLILLLLLLPRSADTQKPARPRTRTHARRPECDPAAASAARPPTDRLDAIARWIGTPQGRGRIAPSAPDAGVPQAVRVWEASGELATRTIRIGRMVGAGLAGAVYEAEDEYGTRFVEKHYGGIPASGGKRLGRSMASMIFALFRQAPLSFRELPEAVVAMHLANRFIVAASVERFGCAITPPLLYTRYDPRTGGYVQAFAHVEGRPLRPAAPGLPLLGEAAIFRGVMRRWRDFLADELGFWGLARQVDPANVNAYSNLWVTPDDHVVLLDVVPGVPGIEPRYLWQGLRRGQFAPFGDAVDLARLERWVESHPPRERAPLSADLELLRLSVERWQASEPRLVSSPLRPLRVLTDSRVRALTRRALLTHIEVKGAVSTEQAAAYRAQLEATGRFPKIVRHSLLKMAPLPVHLAAVDRAHAWRLIRRAPRLPFRLLRGVTSFLLRMVPRLGGLFVALARHLVSHELRMRTFKERVDGWIDGELEAGRLADGEAHELRRSVDQDEETADLAGLFVVHLLVSAVKHSLFGPSAVWLGVALATETWWLALPAMIAPTLRVIAALWMGFGRRPGLIVLCALPDVGVLAVPLYLARRRPQLGNFIVRVLAGKFALSVPAFGQRGGLLEMAAVGGVEALVLGPAVVMPWAALAAILAALQGVWWAVLLALAVYGAAVALALVRRPSGYPDGRGGAGWQLGLPPDAARVEPVGASS